MKKMIDWIKMMTWKKKNASGETLPRLSATEALIIQLLLNSSEEMYGLQMIEKSNGKLKRGTIYITLQRMEGKRLIESKPQERTKPEIGIHRRVYKVTSYGVRVYSAFETLVQSLQQ
jgi:PadR family transcriptional regulator, regulatory protein PadR